MRIEWVWDSDEYAEAWWSGELLREYGAASPMLYEFGGWEIARLGIAWRLKDACDRIREALGVEP